MDVNDYVAGAKYRLGEGTADYKSLMIEMLAAWDVNNPPELLHALGRTFTMLRETVHSDDPRVRAVKEALPLSLDAIEYDGLALDDYIAVHCCPN